MDEGISLYVSTGYVDLYDILVYDGGRKVHEKLSLTLKTGEDKPMAKLFVE